jgi:hypothetical protein
VETDLTFDHRRIHGMEVDPMLVMSQAWSLLGDVRHPCMHNTSYLLTWLASHGGMSLQVLLTGRFDGFMVLAMLWAAVNAIPPLLFIVYFFTKGWLLRWSCFLGQILGLLLGAGASIMHMSHVSLH